MIIEISDNDFGILNDVVDDNFPRKNNESNFEILLELIANGEVVVISRNIWDDIKKQSTACRRCSNVCDLDSLNLLSNRENQGNQANQGNQGKLEQQICIWLNSKEGKDLLEKELKKVEAYCQNNILPSISDKTLNKRFDI